MSTQLGSLTIYQDARDAIKLWGRQVASTAPADAEILAWVASTSKWTPTDIDDLISAKYVAVAGDGMTGDLVMDDSDINPLTNGEGSLGLTGTRWGDGFFDDLAVTNVVTSPSFVGALTGNASTASAVAAANLTGATLAAGVTASSLTSLGIIASLVATTVDINGGTIDGTNIGVSVQGSLSATTGAFSGVVAGTGGATFSGTLGGSAEFTPSSTLEAVGATDAGFTIYHSGDADLVREGFIIFGAKHAGGTAVKVASISTHWAASAEADGFSTLRLNAAYQEASVQKDDLQVILWGGNGCGIFAPDSLAATAPGNNILKNWGATQLIGSLTMSAQISMDLGSGTNFGTWQTTSGAAGVGDFILRNDTATGSMRVSLGNNGSANWVTWSVYGSGHATKANEMRLGTEGEGDAVFVTNGSPALTLDGTTKAATFTGNMGVGQTAGTSALGVLEADAVPAGIFTNSHASTPDGILVDFSGAAPNDQTQWFLQLTDSGATRFNIWSDGSILSDLTTADTAHLELRSTGDVAHGMTAIVDTATYLTVAKAEATSGGARFRGWKDADGAAGAAFQVNGVLGEAGDTNKTTGARGIVELVAQIKAGASVGVAGSDENLVVIRNDSTARFIFDAEGSAHADVEWTTFDSHDDVALLRDLEAHLVPDIFGQAMTYNLDHFQDIGILNGVRKESAGVMRGMLNQTRLAMLHTGAISQVATRVETLEAQVEGLEAELALLKAA